MSSARETWEKRIKVENKKPSSDGGLGHTELRDRWMERYPGVVFGQDEWKHYSNGFWSSIEEGSVEQQILDVLEGSEHEGVKVTSGLLTSVMRIARATVHKTRSLWNANPDILVLGNGTLEVSEREFREHRETDFATSALPYDYDPSAECEVFKKVLGQAVPDAVDFLQEFAGYCLTPDTYHEIALWFKGARGSGKSTIIEGLQAMLGAQYGILGLAEIESSSFALSKVPGKKLLTSTEQPAAYVKSTYIIDALISGETLRIESKYRNAEEIKPIAKVIWAMNELPRFASAQAGIFRRVKVLEFPRLKGPKNPQVKEWIKLEGPGILNWALDGLGRLEARGGFDFPQSVQTATANWEQSNDLPAQFAEEECVRDAKEEVGASLLYNRYQEWCKSNGHSAMSANRVAEEWRRLDFERVTKRGKRFWKGVRLRGVGD